MKLYNTYEKFFSPTFIAKYHDTVLHDLFHQILAFLLFPINCSCRTACLCRELRESVVICMNTRLYNKAKKEKRDANFLHNIRLLLRIPEYNILTKYYLEEYFLRMIKQEFKQIDEENYFRNIEQFVWTLIHFNKPLESLPVRELGTTAKEESTKMNLAKKHLKTNAIELQKKSSPPDQKNFWEHFKKYKSICHFIAAYEFMKREKKPGWHFSLL